MNIKFVKINRKLNNAGENFITEEGFWRLLNKSQNCSLAKKKEILDAFHKKGFLLNKNFSEDIIPNERKEIEFISKLEQALKPLHIKGIKQYKVLNYRIDYYIPKLNIAIEYDENNHDNYTYEQQEGRQKEIEKELGCKFIRVTDKKSNTYNIGIIFKNLIEEENN